ncbi:TPA: hypothetical protein ACKP06_003365 [Serratia marcescens]|uniref:hypothetical protein n=1 Tax=Serratia ureilytica TaxID=300181 RepID=UPI0018D6F512|nr:hypothetical protein [Serratia ureilytica]MBH3319159.1 hypothetical protein [Serratia ureilytica]
MNLIDFTKFLLVPIMAAILTKIVEIGIKTSYESKMKSSEVSGNDNLLDQLVLNEEKALSRKKIIRTRNSDISDILIKYLLSIKNGRKYEFKLSSLKKTSRHIKLYDNKLVLNDNVGYYSTIAALALFNIFVIAIFSAPIFILNERLSISLSVLFQLIMFFSVLGFILLTQEIQKLYIGRKLCNSINKDILGNSAH